MELPCSKIASGFLQAYRLVKRVIEHKGDNTFLSASGGGISAGVSRDFVATATGIKRKDGRIFPAPDPELYSS